MRQATSLMQPFGWLHAADDDFVENEIAGRFGAHDTGQCNGNRSRKNGENATLNGKSSVRTITLSLTDNNWSKMFRRSFFKSLN